MLRCGVNFVRILKLVKQQNGEFVKSERLFDCVNSSCFHRHNPVISCRYVSNNNSRNFCVSTVESNYDSKNQQTSSSWDDISNLDINAVTNGDPSLEKKLKILFLEREILKQEGYKVPKNIKIDQWKELLQMTSRNQRKKFFKFMFSVEMKKQNRKTKKEESKLERKNEKREKESPSDRILYGFNGSTIFLRVYETTMNNFYNYNAIRAMIFGQKVVFDCSYDEHMNARESKNCAKQLMLVFSENRIHPQPFNLYFTNAHAESPTMKYLHKSIPPLYEDTFPLNITEKSYLDIFPKEDLVYLTPHCREELLHYNHDDIYIVGAMVDKANAEPLSLAKAKKEGLRMAKLPLDRYLEWGSGSGKNLTLNHMLNILLDQQIYGDWKKSLRHVPQRKLIRDRPMKRSDLARKEFIISKLFT